ncbi:MAG: hypothetical protein E6R03_07545 [Hyphomicrobiaceae bacterium]|nr:MAG: hypothetical protein E6R03_07545 [Hyphomicrobiaceae bacterium]
MATDQRKNIQEMIDELKEAVDLGNSLQRLRENRHFKKVVLEGYFKEEPVRLVHARSDETLQNPAIQARIMAQIDAVGTFSQFLRTIEQQAEIAKTQIQQGEQMLEEMADEDAPGTGDNGSDGNASPLSIGDDQE